MKFRTKLAIKMAKQTEMKLESISTDNGLLHYVDELVVGVDVWVEDADGNAMLPDDGNYTSDGKVIVVENGVVVDIKESEEIVDIENKDSIEQEIDPNDVPTEEQGEVVSVEKFNDLVEVVKELTQEVNDLEEEVLAVTTELKAALSLSKTKFIPPVEVEVESTGNKPSQLSKFGLKK